MSRILFSSLNPPNLFPLQSFLLRIFMDVCDRTLKISPYLLIQCNLRKQNISSMIDSIIQMLCYYSTAGMCYDHRLWRVE